MHGVEQQLHINGAQFIGPLTTVAITETEYARVLHRTPVSKNIGSV